MKKLIGILLIIVIVLAAAVLYVFTRSPKPLDRPHIIVALIDTLRADHVGCYGYPRPTTPYIDTLAAQGTIYENVYSPTSWTLPALATIFLGLNPQQHGVTEGLQTLGVLAYQHQLSSKHRTVTERLANEGYLTIGFSTNIHIAASTGFDQGFSTFREATSSNAEMVEQMVTDNLGRFREANYHGKPYFLFMHFFDPHTPYLVREPYIKEVAPNLDTDAFLAASPMNGDLMYGFEPGHFGDHPEQIQALKDVYDSEIAATDAALGRIIAGLPGSDRAVIIVLSDHGEAFYEHETMLHGYDLHEETVRVPLIIREPMRPNPSPGGRRVKDIVGLIDLAPMVLGYAGAPHDDLPGVDITKAIPERRTFPFHLHRGPVQMHGAMIWPKKLIVDTKSKTEKLYALNVDPLEKGPLDIGTNEEELRKAAEEAARIEPEIKAVLVRNEFVVNKEQLQALGYLTEGRQAPKGEKNELAKSATPSPTPWVVELNVCQTLSAIKKKCAMPDPVEQKACVKERLDDLIEKTCHKASSYNYRKKCEFMRLDSALRICEHSQAGNLSP